MRIKILSLLLLFFLFPKGVSAQENTRLGEIIEDATDVASCDSINYPILSELKFQESDFLQKTYDYELTNKINSLRKLSSEMKYTGLAVLIGVCAINAFITVDYDLPVAVCIPVAVAVGGGGMVGCMLYSKKLSDKANALEAQTAYLYNVNQNISIGATTFRNPKEQKLLALGVGVKVNF